MKRVEINGQSYIIPEITFEEICRLEENGVYLLSMSRKDRSVASMLRGIVAWIMNAEPEVASAEIQAHLMNGGQIDQILVAVREAMDESGFFGAARSTEKATPQLQDHLPKASQKKSTARTPKS